MQHIRSKKSCADFFLFTSHFRKCIPLPWQRLPFFYPMFNVKKYRSVITKSGNLIFVFRDVKSIGDTFKSVRRQGCQIVLDRVARSPFFTETSKNSTLVVFSEVKGEKRCQILLECCQSMPDYDLCNFFFIFFVKTVIWHQCL